MRYTRSDVRLVDAAWLPTGHWRCFPATPEEPESDTGLSDYQNGSTPSSRFSLGNEHYRAHGKVLENQRAEVIINETDKGYLSTVLRAAFPSMNSTKHHASDQHSASTSTSTLRELEKLPIPQLSIVIMINGTREEVQGYFTIGKLLKDEHGHRVRIAAEPLYKDVIEKEYGLEFFGVGSEVRFLQPYTNVPVEPVPSRASPEDPELNRRQEWELEALKGYWRACYQPSGNHNACPFVADAIIADTRSVAHIHCAEMLGVPVHIMSSIPTSPSRDYSNSMVNIQSNTLNKEDANIMSSLMFDLM